MPIANIRDNIRQRFYNAFGERYVIKWPNESPSGAPSGDEQVDCWMRLSILIGERSQPGKGAVGQRDFRTPGVMVVQIFLRIGLGEQEANKIVDEILKEFEGTTQDKITFTAVQPEYDTGIDDGWYQVNVNCPFFANESR